LISLAKSAWRRHASPWRIFGTAGADEATPEALAAREKHIIHAVKSPRRLAERKALFTFRLP
jgi:hypothetical protein